MATGRSRAEAFDAAVESADQRPPSGAETDYLRACVADQRAAVSKIEDALDGWKTSLRTAKAELAEAEAALSAATRGAE